MKPYRPRNAAKTSPVKLAELDFDMTRSQVPPVTIHHEAATTTTSHLKEGV